MKLNDLILIVYYPVCAGGKFTINSLGLSRYCTLHDYQLARWDASQSNHDQVYYQTKLEYVLKTVPDTKNDQNWIRFEMGNGHQLFKNNQFINSAAKLITRNNQCFCITVHDQNLLDPMLEITTATRVIKLTNFTQWMRTSAFKHKGTEDDIENKVAAHKFLDQKEMQNKSWFYTIDMDCGMQDQSLMQQQIQSLYEKLGWDDFDQTSWAQYYQRYIQSHNLLP